jgi:hypothetical protein
MGCSRISIAGSWQYSLHRIALIHRRREYHIQHIARRCILTITRTVKFRSKRIISDRPYAILEMDSIALGWSEVSSSVSVYSLSSYACMGLRLFCALQVLKMSTGTGTKLTTARNAFSNPP